MNTYYGIRCNDNRKVNLKNVTKVTFEFCSVDEVVPSHAVNYAGQVDVISGRVLDRETIVEYSRVANRQADCQRREASVPLTSKEEKARRALRKEIAADFREKYGYDPAKASLDRLVQEKSPRKYHVSKEWLSEQGKDLVDRTSEDAFLRAEHDPDESVRAFAAQFTGRRRDVLECLVAQSNGEIGWGWRKELAEEWGVAPYVITRDVAEIGKAFRVWLKKVHG